MKELLKLNGLERAVPIVIIANIPVWLFGALGLGLSLEYGHWGNDTSLALVLFIYLPVATVGAAIAALTSLPEWFRQGLLWTIAVWGVLTVALAAVWVIWLATQ